ncbi:MAG: M28 family peptidase [Thermoguttaceae bacterium]
MSFVFAVSRRLFRPRKKNAAYHTAWDSISGAEMLGYVQLLSDKEMEGREAGSRGGRKAADYLQKKFAELKLRPAGENGKFAQDLPPNYRNILGIIPGKDPQLKKQIIVVGAHYDHVGFGNMRNSYGPYNTIHPGADDNASGTSALLELAQAFSFLPNSPKRTILLAAWDGEEKGIIGSSYWAAHPTVSFDKILAAFNLDMIGHLRDDHLYVYGVRTSGPWRRLLCRANDELGLQMEFVWMFKPIADYYPFFAHDVPVLMLHTGMHENYHRPSDTADKINAEGLGRVVRLLFGVVYELSESNETLPFRKASRREYARKPQTFDKQVFVPPERLGVALDPKPAEKGGVRVVRVIPGLPAEKAGIKPGDRILRCADEQIHCDDDLIGAVMSAASPLSLLLQRENAQQPENLSVELAGRPLRLGITWRVDDAEPGAIILTYVVPGSPADRAGLKAEDRIYQIAGHEITDEEFFQKMAATLADPLELLVDRDGVLRTVIIHLKKVAPLKRAA